ncbi:MAG: acetylxylan esterase [Myxococcota bacterium]
MNASAAFRVDRSEPLGLWTGSIEPPASDPELRALRFEFSSRGDRVPGRLWLPPSGDGPFPLVLLQHGLGASKDAPYLDATAGPWVRRGVAVASIDFPLHGDRSDAKSARHLASVLAPVADTDPASQSFFVSCLRQSVIDLQRTLDAVAGMRIIDESRIAYAGFSLGTIVGAIFCSVDSRPRAAALALGGGGFGPSEVDPVRHVAGIAPRPVLFVNATHDATIPREASEALFEAAGEPKELLWFDGTHTQLPGRALKAMWLFLRRHL